jgi:hypothetical protein
MAAEGSKIVQRGLVLLMVMVGLAVAVLVVLLRRPGQPEAPANKEPAKVFALVTPGSAFPGNIAWSAVYQVGASLPSAPGWEIRYTATRVLANRGSSRLPLDVLAEMLDEERQMRNFQARLVDGRLVADAGAAGQEVVIALKAVSEWHRHADAVQAVGAASPQLQKVYQAVQKLTQSTNNVVRTRAQETLLAIAPTRK